MTLNIAHRGFSGKYPENTMIAFKKAITEGFCDGIELDVQLSKDSIPVIIHDENLKRTTGVDALVKDLTLEELKKLDAGSNQSIPTLEEYLELAKKHNLLTNIELKNSIIPYTGLENIVLDLIYKFKLEKNVILSSFNHESMVLIKSLDKTIKTGILYDGIILNPYKYCTECLADAIHPSYHSILLCKKANKKVLENSLEINTYTVNKEKDMKKLLDFNVTAIITNYPDKLHSLIQNNI